MGSQFVVEVNCLIFKSTLSTVANLTTEVLYTCLVFSDSVSVMSEFILIHFHLCLFCLDGSYMP